MRADGTAVRRLTDTAAGVDNTQPRFSPDGRFVLFASTRSGGRHQLFRVRVSDGGGAKQLTFRQNGALMPTFSPDGRRIAFVASSAGWPAVWTMNADGGGLRVVARHVGRVVAYPRFSPDGKRVLYSVFRGGDTVSDFRLRTVRLDGSMSRDIGPGGEPDW